LIIFPIFPYHISQFYVNLTIWPYYYFHYY